MMSAAGACCLSSRSDLIPRTLPTLRCRMILVCSGGGIAPFQELARHPIPATSMKSFAHGHFAPCLASCVCDLDAQGRVCAGVRGRDLLKSLHLIKACPIAKVCLPDCASAEVVRGGQEPPRTFALPYHLSHINIPHVSATPSLTNTAFPPIERIVVSASCPHTQTSLNPTKRRQRYGPRCHLDPPSGSGVGNIRYL